MSSEVVVRDQQAVAVAPNPLAMVADAIQRGTDPATIKALMDLAERYEKSEAAKAFNVAFAAFRSEAVQIIKNKKVDAGPLSGKKYAELFSVVNAVTPALSKHGLAASWKLTKDEKDWIEVTCTVKHLLGHTDSVSMGGPPDTGGAKSPIQARASTVSYLQRYTLKAICGVSEQGDDTDGKPAKRMEEGTKADFLAAISELTTNDAAAALWQKIAAATTAAGDVEAHDEFRAAMAAKRKTLGKKDQAI